MLGYIYILETESKGNITVPENLVPTVYNWVLQNNKF